MPKCFTKPLVYRAKNEEEDVAQMFVDQLEKDIYNIYQIFDKPKEMIYTRKDKEKFMKSKAYWICRKPFLKDDKKVRDHCHFTGKFSGVAHNSCNLQFKKTRFYPCLLS